MSAPRSVAILGGSGLVGSHVIRQLERDDRVGHLRAITRRPLRNAPAKLETANIDFDALGSAAHLLRADAVVCALGTTIRKAGSREAFRRVDHDYVVEAARLAKAEGTRHFLVVSALGANPSSRIFYNRVKGEMERDVRAIGFERLTIVRPSLLLGHRDEFRLGEHIAGLVGILIPGNARPVRAADVASVMIDRIFNGPDGVEVMESGEMRKRARAAQSARS